MAAPTPVTCVPVPPVLVASDLDRTLIYSRAASSLPDGETVALRCVETYLDEPASFMTEAAVAAVEAVGRAAVLVPVTTRTMAQLARVRLPGASRWAVAANGGHLLHDGAPDAAWRHAVAAAVARSTPLAQVHAHLSAVLDPAWTHALRVADELFCYAVVRLDLLPVDLLPELVAWAGTRGWRVSVQGRKVYAVPDPLTKSAAVRELARRLDADVVLAAGDSLLDADLLDAADLAVKPAHGELSAAGWTAAHVSTTRRDGVLGGEDVALWLLSQVRAATATPAR